MPPKEDAPISTLGFKYAEKRNSLSKSPETWLEDKRKNDGAEGYWRIHDDLYDLTDFVDKHPGGEMWLELTRGTDITEAYEAHHLTKLPDYILPKLHIRKAKTSRNSPYTFKDDGFYRTLKKEVIEVYSKLPRNLHLKSDYLADITFLCLYVFATLACRYWSYTFGALAGAFLCFCVIIGHNYFHRKDNWRMYMFDLSFMGVRDWRVSHALSHHLLTNSIYDMEISMFEPILEYLPTQKSKLKKFAMWVYSPLTWLTLFHLSLLKRLVIFPIKGKYEHLTRGDFIPFSLLLVMWYLGGQNLWETLWMWTFVELFASFHFGFVGLNAAHHHPDIFHDGDAVRKDKDWGICQLDAVMDRKEIRGSHFLVMTNFGDHALHHMFPTIDHAYLDHFYPVFSRVCKQFGIDVRVTSQLELIKGQFRQLHRTKPNTEVTDLLKYSKNKKQ